MSRYEFNTWVKANAERLVEEFTEVIRIEPITDPANGAYAWEEFIEEAFFDYLNGINEDTGDMVLTDDELDDIINSTEGITNDEF